MIIRQSLQSIQELLQREVIIIIVLGILCLRKAPHIISCEVLGLVYEVGEGVGRGGNNVAKDITQLLWNELIRLKILKVPDRILLDHICKFLEDWAGCLEGSLDDAALVLGHEGVNCILYEPGILKSISNFSADILTEDFLGLCLCSLLALLTAFGLHLTLGQLFVRFAPCACSSSSVSLREFLKYVISHVLETITE